MKIMGLLGGMSYVSTLEYYKIINQEYAKLFGKHHSPHLIIVSVDFNKVATAMHDARWEQIERILTDATYTLKKAGANFGVICCNSAHKVFLQVQRNVPELPILNILDVVGSELTQKRIKKVGILGTKFVMEDPFYKTYLYEYFNIESVSPHMEDQETIQHIIYQELCLGSIKESAREKLNTIIERLRTDGVEAIILGCTELLLVVSQVDHSIPIIDSTTLHAHYALKYAQLPTQ
jgi:aspartate racemase